MILNLVLKKENINFVFKKFYKMKKFKDIVISRGKKAKLGPVRTRDITLGDIIECIAPEPGFEYGYLGYAYYSVGPDGEIKWQDRVLKEFFERVDKAARPRWCPKIALRLLDLFGNDGSVVRVRNRRLHDIFNRLTKGIRITDTKWKWDSFRIYGSFTKELDELARQACLKIKSPEVAKAEERDKRLGDILKNQKSKL